MREGCEEVSVSVVSKERDKERERERDTERGERTREKNIPSSNDYSSIPEQW